MGAALITLSGGFVGFVQMHETYARASDVKDNAKNIGAITSIQGLQIKQSARYFKELRLVFYRKELRSTNKEIRKLQKDNKYKIPLSLREYYNILLANKKLYEDKLK